MMRTLMGVAALTTALLVGSSGVAQTKARKGSSAADKAKLTKIVKKLDPEIRAAQASLRTARARLQRAINDEVFNEKGAVEGKVIDRLKLALRNCESALRQANVAQALDNGKE